MNSITSSETWRCIFSRQLRIEIGAEKKMGWSGNSNRLIIRMLIALEMCFFKHPMLNNLGQYPAEFPLGEKSCQRSNGVGGGGVLHATCVSTAPLHVEGRLSSGRS